MRSPNRLSSSHLSFLTALLLSLILHGVCLGYGNFQFKDDHNNTVNSLWDERSYDSNSFPDGIPWLLNNWDPNSVIDVNLAEFQAIVNDAFETWQAVPEANIGFTYGGLTDNNSAGDAHGLPPHPALDGDNVIVFDDTPSYALAITCIFTLSDEFTFDDNDADPNNDTNFGGTDPNPDIPEGTYPAGTILDADIVLNINESEWSVTGERRKYDMQGVLVHEIGHFTGLCHSCVRETYYSQATMFSFAASNPEGLELRTLSQDDIAGVSSYYPSASFDANFGSVSGSVTKDGSPFLGAHIWAVKADDRNIIVGVYSDESGNYSLEGLPAGEYVLRVEPICVDRGGINEILGAQTYAIADFQAEIYDEVSDETSAALVTVAPGSASTGYDFTLLDGENPDPFESDDTLAQARPLVPGGSREVHHLYPRDDVDYYRFDANAGTTYRILTSNVCIEQIHGVWNMNSDTVMTLLYPDGAAVARKNHDLDTSNTRWESCVVWTAAKTGTYYIKVAGFLLDGYEGVARNYDIAVDELSPEHRYVDGAIGSDTTGDGSQLAPWASIQHAIDSVAGTLDIPAFIHVAEGRYYENLICDPFESILGGYQTGTWVRDVEGYETILDGNSAGSVIIAADQMEIERFTIRNGLSPYGAGIWCPEGESPVIISNRIVDNLTPSNKAYQGGGIYLGNFADAFICGNFLSDCYAGGRGGSLYSNGSPPYIAENWFTRSHAVWVGGALALDSGGYATIRANRFFNNTVGPDWPAGGGAIYLSGLGFEVSDNVFIQNNAEGLGRGGAIYLSSYSSLGLVRNIFANNWASSDGGAFYRIQSEVNMVGNTFVGNASDKYGGAIRTEYYYNNDFVSNVMVGNYAMYGGAVVYDLYGGQFLNNTVACNRAAESGGAFYIWSINGAPVVANNIIAFNEPEAIFEREANSDCHIQNNDFVAGPSGYLYYDHDSNAVYMTTAEINSEVNNPGCIVADNVDWDAGFRPAPGGTADSIIYEPNTYQSVLTDSNASFEPNALATLTINPDTNQPLHFYIISNTNTTITTWGDMNSVATPPCTYQVFDYHLAKDSRNIEAGMDVSEYVETDIDGDDRPLYSSFDIGADEVFPIAGDFEPDEDVDGADLAIFVEHWLRSRLDSDVYPEEGDGYTDFFDWAVFAAAWLSTPSSPSWDELCDLAPPGGDGIIDWNDSAAFVGQWLHTYCADFAPPPDGDGIVNLLDFAVFAEHWLAGTTP